MLNNDFHQKDQYFRQPSHSTPCFKQQAMCHTVTKAVKTNKERLLEIITKGNTYSNLECKFLLNVLIIYNGTTFNGLDIHLL